MNMTKNIGIIGCESKHAEFFGTLFNIERTFPGYKVSWILGDDAPERLPYVLHKAKISGVCSSAEELIRNCDVVLITYRMSEQHFKPALDCILAGKPVFVDKPFTRDVDEAKTLSDASLSHKVVMMGGSTLCFDPQINLILQNSQRTHFAVIAYRADPDSLFDGYRFYGSHLADLCAEVFGTGALSVQSYRINGNINSLVHYPSISVLLHSTLSFKKPQIIFDQDDGLSITTLNDENCYEYGMRAFIEMVNREELQPQHLDRLVFSTKLLNAIMRSLRTGAEIPLGQPNI